MRCPSCSGELDARTIRDVGVHMCEQCDGVWLAGGDLDRVSGEELETHFDAWMSPPAECRYCNTPLGFSETCVHCHRVPTIQCPRGHGVMDAAVVEVADREFEIDRCPSCRGVWVDGHEREHLDAVEAPVVRQLPPRKHEPGGRMIDRSSSFLDALSVLDTYDRPRRGLVGWLGGPPRLRRRGSLVGTLLALLFAFLLSLTSLCGEFSFTLF